ncbi:XRE family transcriptional regulator [Marinobacterium nitratireducens]|uniref:XRE family transcriptional regulator n=1 Tax=Marinobacterium nitratireducens TaxID=518897 RepID=A0A917Z6T2_9GAMM|nr:cupin domain-containing protein [Marinobacterium nitratireducens]GGO76679.1 XRE family transcriptional regulator [Marinobacterium nitratireducens]
MDVGDRLKKIRQIYGFSQRELAKRVGMTNSTISMIEQNRVSPSVSSLKKILDGIPMSVTEFFTADFSEHDKVVYRPDELIDIGSDGIELKLVGSVEQKSNLALLIETYAPGADTGTEMMSHEGEEAGTVIEGTIEVTIGGEVHSLSAGDSYSFSTKIPHRFRNRSKKVCRIVSAHTPPTF